MATKNEEKTQAKNVKVDKPQKVRIMSLVSRFKRIGAEGVKDRKELAAKAYEECETSKQLINVRGKRITLQAVERHVGNFLRDVKNERKGHWQSIKIVEDETSLKLAPKE